MNLKSLQGNFGVRRAWFASLILSNYVRTTLQDFHENFSIVFPRKKLEYGKSGSIGQSPSDEPLRLQSLKQVWPFFPLQPSFETLHHTSKSENQPNSTSNAQKTPRVSRNACLRAPDAV